MDLVIFRVSLPNKSLPNVLPHEISGRVREWMEQQLHEPHLASRSRGQLPFRLVTCDTTGLSCPAIRTGCG